MGCIYYIIGIVAFLFLFNLDEKINWWGSTILASFFVLLFWFKHIPESSVESSAASLAKTALINLFLGGFFTLIVFGHVYKDYNEAVNGEIYSAEVLSIQEEICKLGRIKRRTESPCWIVTTESEIGEEVTTTFTEGEYQLGGSAWHIKFQDLDVFSFERVEKVNVYSQKPDLMTEFNQDIDNYFGFGRVMMIISLGALVSGCLRFVYLSRKIIAQPSVAIATKTFDENPEPVGRTRSDSDTGADKSPQMLTNSEIQPMSAGSGDPLTTVSKDGLFSEKRASREKDSDPIMVLGVISVLLAGALIAAYQLGFIAL
ncbi:hypothetical protein N9L29_03410 [Litoricolaceae bacterium]|nr:hypothetical protein [Litorivicinaceae bacterium]